MANIASIHQLPLFSSSHLCVFCFFFSMENQCQCCSLVLESVSGIGTTTISTHNSCVHIQPKNKTGLWSFQNTLTSKNVSHEIHKKKPVSCILVIYLYNRNLTVQIPQLRCKGRNTLAFIPPDLIPQTSL